MVKDLVIHTNNKGVEIALLEDSRLVEYHLDKPEDNSFSAGNIFFARIKKINPSLNAAFVQIGHKKDAFIHYTDLGPKIRSLVKYGIQAVKGEADPTLANFKHEKEIQKGGNISEVLKSGDYVITQVMKEAISTKGPRLTSEITLPGRYIVLVPFSNSIGLSKKINDKAERKRLIRLIESIRPKNFGIVVRTNAIGKKTGEIHKDITKLLDKWKKITHNLKNEKPPKLVLSEINKPLSIIRDILNDSFNSIATDDEELFMGIKDYVGSIAPGKSSIVKHHKNKKPIFEQYHVSRQIKSAFGSTVTMKSGAYLVIEHTEAMHVIDINSGPRINKSIDQDEYAFKVNEEAAIEIARQLRLRDIGGIIVVDFIDMRPYPLRNKLLKVMQAAMRPDKAKHSILPLSKFGLMEITRQRVRPAIKIDTSEPNPDKDDRIESCILLVDKIERDVEKAILKSKKGLYLYVHPFIEAYLSKGIKSIKNKWMWKHKKRVHIYSDSSFNLLDYHIGDKDGKPIN